MDVSDIKLLQTIYYILASSISIRKHMSLYEFRSFLIAELRKQKFRIDLFDEDYENRLLEIIDLLKGNPNREYFVASFPFFNTCNSLIFDLVHCTSNFEGFKLYKETAWKVFNGQSSSKMQSGESFQLSLVDIGTIQPDDRCYTVNNIVDYIQGQFLGKQHVLKDDIWNFVDMHPVFPTKGYKKEICKLLKEIYGAHISTSYIDFSDKKRSY